MIISIIKLYKSYYNINYNNNIGKDKRIFYIFLEKIEGT